MLTLRKITFEIFFITAFFCLSGCEADNPVDSGTKIMGTVYDKRGFSVSNSIVNIGNQQPYYLTQADGKFSFDVQSSEYDVMINDKVRYIGLSSRNLNLISNYSAHYNGLVANISIPKLNKKGEVGLLKFLSDEINYSEFIFNSAGKVSPLIIYYPVLKTSIEGKIVFLSVIFDNNNFITSYEHYGEKNVSLTPNSFYDTVFFNENDISFNPPECEITFSVLSDISDNTHSLFSLDFKDYKYSSFIPLRRFVSKNNINEIKFIEPALLTLPFNVRINTSQNINDSNNFFSFLSNEKILNLGPCLNSGVFFSNKLILQSPDNNQFDVDRNTNFIFECSGAEGVYEFNINLIFNKGLHLIARVYTDKNLINFGELIDNGFEFSFPDYYEWYVIKYLGYNSINDFVEKPYNPENNNNGTITSAHRNFRTISSR